jgi:streptogramin lyase
LRSCIRSVQALTDKFGIPKFEIPLTPGAMPGTHHVVPQKDGTVWFSENWAHKLAKLDPRTGKFTQVQIDSPVRLNSPGFGDFAQTPDGMVWDVLQGTPGLDKIDPETGKTVAQYPMKVGIAYESTISADGKFWAGATAEAGPGNAAALFDIQSGTMLNLDSGSRRSSGKRGSFDPLGNAWFGGVNGTLVELDAKARKIREFWPPTPVLPYTDFYDAAPDKNGEVWGGVLHGSWFVRFNPKKAEWTVYTMPEPFAHSRKAWIDESTKPVTVWYVDTSTGCLVRLQPMK